MGGGHAEGANVARKCGVSVCIYAEFGNVSSDDGDILCVGGGHAERANVTRKCGFSVCMCVCLYLCSYLGKCFLKCARIVRVFCVKCA